MKSNLKSKTDIELQFQFQIDIQYSLFDIYKEARRQKGFFLA